MDTRQTPRFSVNMTGTCSIIDKSVNLVSGNKFPVKIFNISEGGIGMSLKYYLPKGITIEIGMIVSNESFRLSKNILIRGEICYCRSDKYGEYKCGMKFLNLTDEQKSEIKQLVLNCDRMSKVWSKLVSPL